MSSDGKTWTRLKGYSKFYSAIISGRNRGLIHTWSSSFAPDTLCVINDKLVLVTLKQTGDVRWIDDWQMALGPTGLLVTSDRRRFWIGGRRRADRLAIRPLR